MNPLKRAVRRFSLRLLDITDAWEPVERVLSADLEAELMLHPGKWVTMTHDRLIAVGTTPTEVLEAAHAAGVTDAILHRVSEPGAVYVL